MHTQFFRHLFERTSDVLKIKSNLVLYSENCMYSGKFSTNGSYISSLFIYLTDLNERKVYGPIILKIYGRP